MTSLGKGFRYQPVWSPDSRKLAFIDEGMRLRITDLDTKRDQQVDHRPSWISQGGLDDFRIAWSPDSHFLAFARNGSTENGAIFIVDAKTGDKHQVTAGYFNDDQPTFDPEGKYLFFTSDRTFDPVYGRFDNSCDIRQRDEHRCRAPKKGSGVSDGASKRRRERQEGGQREEGRQRRRKEG